jgi:DNA-binding transcriptional MerR regulator
MTIGRVAAAAGVSVETIRYYQRRGLLEEPAKPIGGYRRYPAEMVNRIYFILACRRFCCRKENAPKPEDRGIIHEL